MNPRNARLTQTVGFILLPGFALMSYAAAIEPLRAANLLAGQPLYDLYMVSLDGRAVASSSGAVIPCLSLRELKSPVNTVFICAGGNPKMWRVAGLRTALRRLARQGVRLGGISGGPYVLASAGLLDDRDFTIHWEHASALAEAFPHLRPRPARFVLDGNRITCGGGVAPLDMMHALIAERMGADFARRVSDWYLHTVVAEPGAPQRASTAERFGVHHPALLSMLDKMESSVEQPLTRLMMAKFAGISERHLDRLFAQHLGAGFLEVYRRLRLEHARRLLRQSPLSSAEIAFATGFSSAGHFATSYKRHFGKSPRLDRR